MDTSGDIKPSTKWNHISLVPHLESATNCDFSVTQHVLLTTSKLRLGRYTDSFNFPDRISFKSSAVSREHAEIYVSGGQVSSKL
jgi:hypothetical protein